ncbi:MAG: hypothetical protein RLZZ519_3102, partial [Bacteroidota bacterium]
MMLRCHRFNSFVQLHRKLQTTEGKLSRFPQRDTLNIYRFIPRMSRRCFWSGSLRKSTLCFRLEIGMV